MKVTKLKQGTLAWEKAREKRIGSSEVFDIVKYYATDTELQNCGINAEKFRKESPYTSVWALYHKILDDGLYHKESIGLENAEYGHCVEPYGVSKLQQGRSHKVRSGDVYVEKRLIASLDAGGIAEEKDIIPFDFGTGTPKLGQKFVCEQKSMRPAIVKNGIPFKYIIQAQYQINMCKADFFILQVMVLDEDTDFIRGKICQMSKKKRFQYLDEHLKVWNYYFQNNHHLSKLIDVCLKRFFADVDEKREPTAFLSNDTQANIIKSIRENSLYNDEMTCEYDLLLYTELKNKETIATEKRKKEQQKLIEFAKVNNACRFNSFDGTTTAMFGKDGRLYIREVEK